MFGIRLVLRPGLLVRSLHIWHRVDQILWHTTLVASVEALAVKLSSLIPLRSFVVLGHWLYDIMDTLIERLVILIFGLI